MLWTWLETLIPDLCQGACPDQDGEYQPTFISSPRFYAICKFRLIPQPEIRETGDKTSQKGLAQTQISCVLSLPLSLSLRSVHPREHFPYAPSWDKTLFQKKSGSRGQLPKSFQACQCWMVYPMGSCSTR